MFWRYKGIRHELLSHCSYGRREEPFESFSSSNISNQELFWRILNELSNTTLVQLQLAIYPSYFASPSRESRTAVNLKSITRHMRTPRTAQEQHQPTEIARLANPARRLSRIKRIRIFLQPKVCHSRRKDTGANDIAHDVLRREFGSLHLGKVDARRFGRTIYAMTALLVCISFVNLQLAQTKKREKGKYEIL